MIESSKDNLIIFANIFGILIMKKFKVFQINN